MTEFLDIDVLGLRMRVELGTDLDDAQRRDVRRAWTGAAGTGDGTPDLTLTFTAGTDFDRAMERLTVDVTLAALDALRGRALMFHAAGVADDRGRVAAFVGPSGRGKTTLSRELARHCGYVTDETVAADADLRVQAYRKPLSVVRDGAPKQQVSPEEAGLGDLPGAELRLAALVLIERDEQLGAPEIASVPLVEALPELVSQMSYLREQRRPLQTIAALSDAIGGVRRLRYPDSSTVPPLLPQLLDSAAEASVWHPLPDAADSGPYSVDVVDDAILTDGFVIVMAGANLQVLDGIAPTVWIACARGDDLDGIVRAVVAEHGAPPEGDAAERVAAVIDELVDAGALRRR
ncbi:PqqD family peptide modification chaperone [Microbacterium sp. NPDC058342]|uniref:PqqD family peptide modification chaperone n=1 Tax=Microbacterium sp. NPDC058342 TaxID=3346454 RepID=UPI00364C8463